MSGSSKCFVKATLKCSRVFADEVASEEGALDKINRQANEMSGGLTQQGPGDNGFDTVLTQ